MRTPKPAVGQVDAGLDRDDHAGLQRPVGRDVVHLEAHRMAGAVDEGVSVAGLLDDRPGGRVDVGVGGARRGGGDAGQFGLQDYLVDLALLRGEDPGGRAACG